jgi:hypothetical protein
MTERQPSVEVHTSLVSPMQRMVSPGGKMRKHLERGGAPAVRALMTWLEAGAHEDAFAKAGAPQAGDPSPQQVIASQCIHCHNMQGDVADIPYAMDEESQPVFELVSKKAAPMLGPMTQQAQTVSLAPTGRAELVQITHAHILAIPVFTLRDRATG